MWYVIQTKSGDEQKLQLLLEERLGNEYYRQCFVPLYECVRRRKDKCLIMMLRLFPGYLLIDTDYPDEVHNALKGIPDFAVVLGAKENSESQKTFIPISTDDEEFLRSILDDGVMRVSYVHLSKVNRIDKVIGPLEKYRRHITKMEYRHRYATVEAVMFGKKRKINFGLWGDEDPRLPWIEDLKAVQKEDVGNSDSLSDYDIGIHPGDQIEYPELYGDKVFTVDYVDPSRRIIRTTVEMLGCVRKIEMYVDDVQKIS